MNKSGIRAMAESIAKSPAFSHPRFPRLLADAGQPLITRFPVCDCSSTVSWPFFRGPASYEPDSACTGSNSVVELSSFNRRERVRFRNRFIPRAVSQSFAKWRMLKRYAV